MIRDVVGSSLAFYRARRSTVNYFYILCGTASREDSSDGEVVSKICRSPITSANSRHLVLNWAQCTMLLDPLKPNAERPPDLPGLHLHDLVFLDEKHTKKLLGPKTCYQYRIYHNEESIPSLKKDGGKLPVGISRTSFKYAEEARGCFGVAIRKIDDESYVGVKCNPFNYTEKNSKAFRNISS